MLRFINKFFVVYKTVDFVRNFYKFYYRARITENAIIKVSENLKSLKSLENLSLVFGRFKIFLNNTNKIFLVALT